MERNPISAVEQQHGPVTVPPLQQGQAMVQVGGNIEKDFVFDPPMEGCFCCTCAQCPRCSKAGFACCSDAGQWFTFEPFDPALWNGRLEEEEYWQMENELNEIYLCLGTNRMLWILPIILTGPVGVCLHEDDKKNLPSRIQARCAMWSERFGARGLKFSYDQADSKWPEKPVTPIRVKIVA